MIIARATSTAFRAHRPAASTLPYLHFQCRSTAVAKSYRRVDKTPVPFDPIENSLEVHPVLPPVGWSLVNSSIRKNGTGCTFPPMLLPGHLLPEHFFATNTLHCC